MTNVLGGGRGNDGFHRLIAHLGPGVQKWIEDMNAHAFKFSDEEVQKLDDSVQEMLEGTVIEEVEDQRDRGLVELIDRKKDASASKWYCSGSHTYHNYFSQVLQPCDAHALKSYLLAWLK